MERDPWGEHVIMVWGGIGINKNVGHVVFHNITLAERLVLRLSDILVTSLDLKLCLILPSLESHVPA